MFYGFFNIRNNPKLFIAVDGPNIKGGAFMKTRTLLAAMSLGLLAACAQMTPLEAVQNTHTRKAAQNARNKARITSLAPLSGHV
jgi:hypothetical protein